MFNKLSRSEDLDEILKLYPYFYQALINKSKKINSAPELIENEIRIHGYKTLPNDAENFFDNMECYLESDTVKLLLMKNINLKLDFIRQNDKLDNILLDKENNGWLESYRIEDKLVFLNPNIPIGKKKIQVYSNPISISRDYDKHNSNSSGNASKFYPKINPKLIDILGFNNGVGHLYITSPESIIFFYLKFQEEIGITKDKKPTKFVKIHIGNERKNKNYKQMIHSYPIDEESMNNSKMKTIKNIIDYNSIDYQIAIAKNFRLYPK